MSVKVVTFFVLEALYFIVCHSGLEFYPAQTLTTVFFKVLPIAYLLLLVSTTQALDGEHSRYKTEVQLALGFSLVGDMFLVWQDAMWEPGVAFFALAHFFYIRAFRIRPMEYESAAIVYLSMVVIFMFFYPSLQSRLDMVLILFYLVLIFTMWWRSIVSWQRQPSFSSLLAGCGAFIFLLSDFCLALDKYRMELPYCAILVMLLYYLAQFTLAMSVYTHTPPGADDLENRTKKQG